VIIVGVIVAAAAILIVLAVVPVPQTSSTHFGSTSSGTGPVIFSDGYSESLCPAGANASVSYTSYGLKLSFSLVDPNGATIWADNATNASTSFNVGACGTYQFDMNGSGDGSYTIDVTLRYSAPIL